MAKHFFFFTFLKPAVVVSVNLLPGRTSKEKKANKFIRLTHQIAPMFLAARVSATDYKLKIEAHSRNAVTDRKT